MQHGTDKEAYEILPETVSDREQPVERVDRLTAIGGVTKHISIPYVWNVRSMQKKYAKRLATIK